MGITGLFCERCGGSEMVMLTGKGLPYACTSCDRAKVEAHAETFARAMDLANAE